MFQGNNQRLQDRFPVSEQDDLLGTLNTPLADQETRLVDLSLTGAAFTVEQPGLLRSADGLNLGLRWHDRLVGFTAVEPVHIRETGSSDGHSHVVGVRFQGSNEPFLQELCTFILNSHSQTLDQPRFASQTGAFNPLKDPKKIAGIFSYCLKNRVPLQLFRISGQPLGTVLVCGVKGRDPSTQALDCQLHGSGSDTLTTGTHYYLVLQTFSSLYIIMSPLMETEGDHGLFGIPSEVLEGGFRRLGRVWLDDSYPVALEFVHPQIPGRFIRKQAREVGLGGMSFPLQTREDMLVKGTVIPSAVLRMPDGHSLPCQCVVRHTLRDGDDHFFGGIEFLDFAGNGRQVWVEELLKHMNPEVRQATPFNLADVWDILDRTGYLSEKPEDQMRGLKEPFLEVWNRLLSERGGGRCWLYTSQGKSFATICVSRIYADTWLIHQLACDMEGFTGPCSKLIMPNLMVPRTAFQWIPGVHPQGDVLVYLDADKPFNRWAWFDVLESNVGHPGLTLQTIGITGFNVDGEGLAPESDIWVRDATPSELDEISGVLAVRDTPHLFEAFGYDARSLTLKETMDGPDGAAIRRERRVLVAGLEEQGADGVGAWVAFALVDSGIKGINVFSLYETCRVVFRESALPPEEAAIREALLTRILDHYRDLCAPSFLWLTGEGDAPPPQHPGVFHATAVRGLFSVELIPRIVTYLNDIWVHR